MNSKLLQDLFLSFPSTVAFQEFREYGHELPFTVGYYIADWVCEGCTP